MSVLEDEFIIACGKANGEFVNMSDGKLGCYLKEPDAYNEYPEQTQILFDRDDTAFINSSLEIGNITSFGHRKNSFMIETEHSELYIEYNSIGGKIR